MNMHRLMGPVLLTVPMVAMAIPAEASLDLLARIFKDKDIQVTQQVFIEKNIRIDVLLSEAYEGAAEADALSNQLNTNNRVVGNIQGDPPGRPAYGINRHARIEESINRNAGIVGVNQDVGNMVNQANVVAAALTASRSSITNSQAEADQVNTDNHSTQLERLRLNADRQIISDPDRSATIQDSISGNSGVVGVNQNSGNMNNQLNKVALAVGPGSHVALSEAALGQVNAGNSVTEIETFRFNTINGSVNNNDGIVGVNQSSGNMNNQASVVSMAVLTSRVALTTP